MSGIYNVSNCLAALPPGEGLGIRLRRRCRPGDAKNRPGSNERIDLGHNSLLSRFAHTPNALAVSLETARGLRKASDRCFRFGGVADREKRR